MDAHRLTQIPLFDGLDEAQRAAIAAVATEVDVTVGERLVTEGDFGHALYAIESGTATVTDNGTVLRELGAGDVFGEIAVLSAGRRTASVVATSPMRLIALFKRDVWRLERTSPETVAKLRSLIEERRSAGANVGSG
jgi:CRP-like cAMP-binding protein